MFQSNPHQKRHITLDGVTYGPPVSPIEIRHAHKKNIPLAQTPLEAKELMGLTPVQVKRLV